MGGLLHVYVRGVLKTSENSEEIQMQVRNTVNNYSALSLESTEVHFKKFRDFASERANTDPNWCFWAEFILSNCSG